jgi:hypothetical protein
MEAYSIYFDVNGENLTALCSKRAAVSRRIIPLKAAAYGLLAAGFENGDDGPCKTG